MFVHSFRHRGRHLAVRLGADGVLALVLEGVMRKSRSPSGKEPTYVSTNVELAWEEHHYIEAYYWASTGRLCITANGQALHDGPGR